MVALQTLKTKNRVLSLLKSSHLTEKGELLRFEGSAHSNATISNLKSSARRDHH
jgi:hypothetical protein